MSLPMVAVSMGDPAGVGPEILVRAAADARVQAQCRLLAVGDLGVLRSAAEILNSDIDLRPSDTSRGPGHTGEGGGTLEVWDMRNVSAPLRRGEVQAAYGRASYEYVTEAIALAMRGDVAAVVTNPINKEAIAAAGVKLAGHTEILAAETGTRDYAMMLAHDPLRVVHVSTHVALRAACDAATRDRVLAVLRLTADAVRRIDGDQKPIAVAGLNPHAGEHGLFGTEEIDHIIPAIEAARAEGIRAEGPLPPDTLFPRALGGEFSAVVVMYHDQGHIPVKMHGFRVDPETGRFADVSGVNITLGLPIIRTSVDHGTAFDIAGTGSASHESLVQAIQYAVRLMPKKEVHD